MNVSSDGQNVSRDSMSVMVLLYDCHGPDAFTKIHSFLPAKSALENF